MAKILESIYEVDSTGRVQLISEEPVRPLAPYRINIRAPFDPSSTSIKWYLNLPVGPTDENFGALDTTYEFDGQYYQWTFVIEEARTDGLNSGPGITTDNELVITMFQDKTLPTYDPDSGVADGTIEVDIPIQLEVINLTVEGFKAVPLTSEPIDNNVEAGFNSRIAALEADQLDYNTKIKKTTIKNDSVKGSIDSLPFGDDNAIPSEDRIVDYVNRVLQGQQAEDDIATYPTYADLITSTDFINDIVTLPDTSQRALVGGETTTVVNDENFNNSSARYQYNSVLHDWINIFNTSIIPIATSTADGLMSSEKFNEVNLNNDMRSNIYDVNTGKIKIDAMAEGTRRFIGKIDADGELPTNLGTSETGYEYIANAEFTDTFWNLSFQPGDVAIWDGIGFIKLDNKDDVLTVNGQKGEVLLRASDINLIDDSTTIQNKLDTLDGEINFLDSTKLSNNVIIDDTLIGNESPNLVVSSKLVKELVDSKTSKVNNNSFNSVVKGLGVDDLTLIDNDTWANTGTGAVVKFIIPDDDNSNNGLPESFGYVLKPFQSTNPFVNTKFASAAFLKIDFNNPITAGDISDNGAGLIIDIPATVDILKEAGVVDDANDLIGKPSLTISYIQDILDLDNSWYDGIFIALFSHIGGVISTIKPFGYNATQGILSAQYIDKGLPVYKRSGLTISGSSNTDYGITVSAGQIFSLGINRGTAALNPDLVNLNAQDDIRIIKAYPDGNGGTVYDTNNGNYYTEINHEEYYNTTQNEVNTTGIGGSDTLVSLFGILLTEPNTLVQILPQVVDPTDNDVVGDALFDNKEDAQIAVNSGEVNYSDIEILQSPLFIPTANLIVESSASNLSTDSEDFIFVPVATIGGTVNYDNNSGELAAINVKNTGVVGFENQEALNQSVDSNLAFRASEDIRIELKTDAVQSDINNIIARINSVREFKQFRIGDGTTTEFSFNISYLPTDIIDISVDGIEYSLGREYDLSDEGGGTLKVTFSDNEIPEIDSNIKLRQVKAI